MTSSIVLIVGAVAYPLSSGPVIYVAHKFAASCDVREPVEAVYEPVLSIADSVGAGWPVNKYLVMFDATSGMRRRHVITRLASARTLIGDGKYDQAQYLVQCLQQWDCPFGPFDDRPIHAIADIAVFRATTMP
jgi:hypothetical protein